MRRPRRHVGNRAVAERAASMIAGVTAVTTVRVGNRTHYAHAENGRTLCGRRGGVIDVGFAQCVRCEQILQQVDTSLMHR